MESWSRAKRRSGPRRASWKRRRATCRAAWCRWAVHPNPAFQGNVCFNFLALDCVKRHEGRQDAGEDIAVELHPRADLPRLILEGHISHSLVVAAFFQERLLSESK
ncbi:hypothetical protein QEG98_10440 [Myxococcus sp. MxC21-1]|uniref:hypothetical protein n=1 Tax=Myxococcus sp. MxC21-1 TaxID=3041439 RepID=UPI00292D16F0|nr:hypothetical protein [Myxococcus sp. MxC21-1]WNZ64057.1 hypothetical protein QEG98_10440 [Myxococcus sp. MxC21-1]